MCREQYHRRKKTPALPLTEERLKHCYPGETLSSICNGIPQTIDPRPISEPSLLINNNSSTSSGLVSLPAPYQPTEAVMQADTRRSNENPGSNVRKRKNYKGQHIGNNVKVRIVRPRLIDTRNIARLNAVVETNVFCNVKKTENEITIKLLERSDNKRKKIVIKNPRYVSPILVCTISRN